jgi:hypothetical protein
MTDKEKKSYGKRMKNARDAMTVFGLSFLLIAAVAVFYSLGVAQSVVDMADEDHMTDPGIPYRDLDNATYTYDREWIESKADSMITYFLWVFVPLVGGLVLFYASILMPSDKDYHKSECKGAGEAKYCSECGLKLSRLERD